MGNLRSKMKALGYKMQDISRGMFVCSSDNKMKLCDSDKVLYDIDEAISEWGGQPAPFSRARVYDWGYGLLREITVVYDDMYYFYIDSNNNIIKADFMMETKDIWICFDKDKVAFYNKKTGYKSIVRTKYAFSGTKLNVGKIVRQYLDTDAKISIKVVDDVNILIKDLFIDTTNGKAVYGLNILIYDKFIAFNQARRDLAVLWAYVYGDSIYELTTSTYYHESKDLEITLYDKNIDGVQGKNWSRKIYGHKKNSVNNIKTFIRKGSN